jgi:hypothetical protein
MKHRLSLRCRATLAAAFVALTSAGTAWGQQAPAAAELDNGTNPTLISRVMETKYEYLDLGQGVRSGALRLNYLQPLGEKSDYAVRLRLPVQMNNALGRDNYGFGDVSLLVLHVFGLTREHGFVWQLEANFDTASRPELGAGKHVLSPTFVYARFLKGGAIFAPAFKHSVSVGGDAHRPDINATTLDFYYVPKLSDPRNLVTFDPAWTYDWERRKQSGSLAVTVGRVLGPMMGGNGIVTLKPTLLVGGDRPAKWGVEASFKVLGF